MADFNFNPKDVPASPVIPKGEYRLVISGTEIKKSQAGHDRLNLRFSVCGGQYANRTFFEGYNNNHPNPETRGISLRQIAAICEAIELAGVLTKTEQFLNGAGGQISKPFNAYVDVKDGGGDFGLQNVLKKPKRIGSGEPITPPAAVVAPAGDVAAPVATTNAAPWEVNA